MLVLRRCLLLCVIIAAVACAPAIMELLSDTQPKDAFPAPDGRCIPVATAYGRLFGVICGIENVSFTLHSPEDWETDWEAGKRLGACVVYTAGAGNVADARALIYAGVYRAQDRQQEKAAQALAEETVKRVPEVILHKVEPYIAQENIRFTLYFFDNIPGPWPCGAVAYLLHDGVVFSLMLSAHDKAGREDALPDFKKALRGVMINGVVN